MPEPDPGKTTQTRLALARLPRNAETAFRLEPDAAERADMAEALKIDALRKLRFEGRLIPEGARDWRLEAHLGATVVQPCVVTLAPVTTRIDTDLTRRYLDDMPEPAEIDGEAEMPEDDTTEALPTHLDLAEVMLEAVALALPDYPRAPDAELETRVFAAPGVAPMRDEDARPLAGLAALRDKLSGDASDDERRGEGGEDDGNGDA